MPPLLILYCNVPLPQQRLSNKPNLHKRLKYVHAERLGEKSSRSATMLGLNQSPFARSNTDKACNLSLLQGFIALILRYRSFCSHQKLVDVWTQNTLWVVPWRPTQKFEFCLLFGLMFYILIVPLEKQSYSQNQRSHNPPARALPIIGRQSQGQATGSHRELRIVGS